MTVQENLVPIARKKAGRPSTCPNFNELAELYKTHTMRELGEHYGVSVSTVSHWIAAQRRKCKQEAEQNGKAN